MAEGVKRRRHNVTLFVNYLSAVEVSVLLVCGAPSLCDRWPTFRTTTLSRNVRHQSARDATSHPRVMETFRLIHVSAVWHATGYNLLA